MKDTTRINRRRRRGDDGVAALEFALLAPVFIMILFAVFEFAVAFNTVQGLHAAAREGARLGSLPQSDVGEINSAVNDAMAIVVSDAAVKSIAVTDANGTTYAGGSQPCNTGADRVQVTVEADTTLAIPFWSSVTIGLAGRGEFLCET